MMRRLQAHQSLYVAILSLAYWPWTKRKVGFTDPASTDFA